MGPKVGVSHRPTFTHDIQRTSGEYIVVSPDSTPTRRVSVGTVSSGSSVPLNKVWEVFYCSTPPLLPLLDSAIDEFYIV